MRRTSLRFVGLRVQEVLAGLKAELFIPEMRLTLVARHPDDDACDLVVTSDDLEQVEAAVRRRRSTENKPGA